MSEDHTPIPVGHYVLPPKMVDNPNRGWQKCFPELFLQLCEQGYWITEIAYFLNVTEEKLDKWSKDPRKPAFQRAYKMGANAAEAYHLMMFKNLISTKAQTQALNGVLALLKIINPKRYGPPQKEEKQDPNANKTPKQIQEELTRQFNFLIRTPAVQHQLLGNANASTDSND